MNNTAFYIPILIFSSFALVFYLLRRYRNRRYIPLLLSIIILIFLNIILVNQLVTQAFKRHLNCDFLIDRPLNSQELSLCHGLSTTPIGPFEFLRPFEVGPITPTEGTSIGPISIPAVRYGPWSIPGLKVGPWTIPILLDLTKTIDPLLDGFRPVMTWGVIIVLALISLLLTYIGGKITAFIHLLRTFAGYRTILTRLNLWLFFFVSLCGLFYCGVVLR